MPTGNAINSAGSLVGSVLESAGYIYQSAILNTLSAPLKNEIGGLVYLIGIIIVIFQIAILKSSKLAPWLLIGPAIFLFVVGERDTIPNAKWSFGNQGRNVAQTTKGVDDITSGGNSARVSKVFKRYVEVVSASMNAIVDKISGTQIENDLWLVTKGQLYGMMTSIQGEEVGLKQLIQTGLVGKCYLAIQMARAVDDPLRRIVQPNAIKAEVDGALRYNVPTQEQAKIDSAALMSERNISFQGNDEILRFIAKEEGKTGADRDKRVTELSGLTFSCAEVWDFTSLAILRKASEHEKDLEREATNIGMSPGAIKNLLLSASGIAGGPLESRSNGNTDSDSAQILSRVIAKFYLRNETRNPDVGSRIAGLVGRNDLRTISAKFGGSNSFTEQSRVGASEWAEKERLMYSAQALPTYQGIALYFLGLAFPFFALLLLIPGKATGFLLWFLLWLWIKSWDVALAIVMQVDTIFWSLYSVQKQKFLAPDVLPTDMGAAFAALELMDPSFQMTGYYSILAVCILTIPVITAQFILGSMRGGASLIAQGVNKYSDFYADAMLTRTEQGIMNQLKSDQIFLKEQRGAALAFGGKIAEQQMRGREDATKVVAPAGTTKFLPNGQPAPEAGSKADERFAVEYNNIAGFRNNEVSRLSTAVSAAQRSKYEGALVAPNRPLGTSANDTLSAILLDAKTKERTYRYDAATQEFAKTKADLNAQTTHTGFLTDIERKSYEIHERIAALRGIPVPWLEFGEEGSAKEVERHKAAFAARIELMRSMLETTKSTAENFQKLKDQYGGVAAAGMMASVQAVETLVATFDPVMMNNVIDNNRLRVLKDENATRQNVIKFYREHYTPLEIEQIRETVTTLNNNNISWHDAVENPTQTASKPEIKQLSLAETAVNSFDPVLLNNAIDFNGVRVEGNDEESKRKLIQLYAENYSQEDIETMTRDLSKFSSGQSGKNVMYRDSREIEFDEMDDKRNRYRPQRSNQTRQSRDFDDD